MTFLIRRRSSRRIVSILALALLACACICILTPASSLAASTWVGNASGAWNTAGNWNPAAIPGTGSKLVFVVAGSAGASLTNDIAASTSFAALTFSNGASAFTLNGNSFTVTGGITNKSANAQSISNPVNMTAATSVVSDAGGGLTFNGAYTANTAGAVTKYGSGTVTFAGTDTICGLIVNGGTNIITGNTAMTGLSGSYFYLGNANTAYNGTLVIQPGAALNVTGTFSDSGVIGRDGGGGTVIQNGGTFSYNPGNQSALYVGAANNTSTRSAYNLNGGLLNLNGKTLTVGFGSGVLITGVVNQVGGIITNVATMYVGYSLGYGNYTLGGGSNYLGAGGLITSSGLYAINLGGGTVGAYANWSSALNLNLTNLNGSVTFLPAGNTITLSGTLSGNGGLTNNSAGTLLLAGTNSYAGDTVVNAGTLQLSASSKLPGALRLASGVVLNLPTSGTLNTVVAFYTNNVALGYGTYNAGNLGSFIAGAGMLQVGSVAVSPASYSFGSVLTGTVAQVTLTITNGGSSAFSGAASVGTAAYSIISGSPYTVAAGGTATVTVQFTPILVASYYDTVQFTIGSQSITAPVAGRGTTLQVITNSNFLFAYEGFNYPAGTNLAGLNGGTGWSSGWVDVAGNAGATVKTGNLLAGTNAPGGYDVLSTGNSAYVGNGNRYGRLLDCSAGGNFDMYGLIDGNGNIGADGTSIYVSFLQQPNSTATNYEFEFHRGNLGDAGRVAGIGNAFNSTTVNLRAPNATQTPLGLGNTNVNYYVVRIDFKSGNDDVYVYRNPTGKSEANNIPVLTMLAVADMSFNGISLAAFGNGVTANHDEIRLGLTWGDILGGPPAFVLQPTNQTLIVGQTAVLAALAQSSQPVSYQWFRSSGALSGQTNASLTLSNPQNSDADGYWVVASNALGVATSSVANLTAQPIGVTVPAQSLTVGPGSNMVVTAAVAGTQPISLQWLKDGTAVSGATNSTFAVSNASVFDAGQYVLVANNANGSVTSAVVSVCANLGGILAYEGFNYSTGTGNLIGQNGGIGWSGTWANLGGSAGSIISSNLVAGTNGPAGYDSHSLGNSAFQANSSRSGCFLDCSAGGNFAAHGLVDTNGNIGADGTTLYVSFLQQPNATGKFYEFEFHRGNLGDPGRMAGIGNDTTDSHVHFRVEAPAGGASTFYDLGPGSTNASFYVVRIDYQGDNDNVYVYRNPTNASESANAPTATLLGVGDLSFNGIAFGAYVNNLTVAHDEVRLGMSWADVVGNSVSLLQMTQRQNGSSRMRLAGSPNNAYDLQGAGLVTGAYTNIARLIVPATGAEDYVESNMPAAQRFYRAVAEPTLPTPNPVLADFEGSTYGAWVTTGTAFGSGPASGALPNQGTVSGYQGSGFANSFNNGDTSTGTLTSPSFTITEHYLNFLIGGGNYPGQECLNLLVNGAIVLTATGTNSETLFPVQWDISAYLGQSAILQIVDTATGSWGHILVDQIVMADSAVQVVSGQILLTNNLLNLPVQNGAAMQRVTVTVGGNPVRDFNIKLATGTPDWWSFVDVSAFSGQTATVTLNGSSTAVGISSIVQTNGIVGATNLYQEALRPQIHFSTKRGWLNDANGMVYYQGQYHLYYQHDPFNWDGSGQKWWGHAVSPDMVQWTELPEGIYSHTYGDQVYSGSMVVDTTNTGGFQAGTNPVIVASYNSTARGQCIDYSTNGGLSYIDYPGNPVVTVPGRDPHMLWYAPSNYWVMAVYDSNLGGIDFFSTPDFHTWTYHSGIAGFFECPDLFQMPVDGNTNNQEWLICDGSSGYMLGQFDGAVFTPNTAKLPGNSGSGFYASQTFTTMPAGDTRRVRIGWAQIATPGMPFNELMYFPTVLTLTTESAGVRLCSQPVAEIANLTATEYAWTNLTLAAGSNPLSGIRGNLFNLQAQFVPGTAELDFIFQGVTVAYNPSTQQITCNGITNPLPPVNGVVQLQILTDINTIEIFGNHGQLYMPLPASYPTTNRLISVSCQSGSTTFNSLTVDKLKSAWAGLTP